MAVTQPPASPVPGLSDLVVIARGGYATVYRARQDSMDRDVALKIDTRTLEDERDRRRFLREAQAAGRMSGHSHIVNVYDAGVTADNHPYLVMELYSGGSYAAKLRKEGPRPPGEVRELGIKIADALFAAHDAGVLHRDVKPANILVNRFDSPGLADFGLAAVVEANRDMSVTVEALTPAYAPPEVFRLDKPTAAGDIYSLCATLYALLSGRPPRWPKEGGPPSPLAIVNLHNQPIPDIPNVPQGLVAVLRRGMSSEPAQRFTSATELKAALTALNEDGTASPELLSEVTGTPLPPAPVFETPSMDQLAPTPVVPAQLPAVLPAPGSKRRGRTKVPMVVGMVACALFAVACLATAAMVWLQEPKSAPAALRPASGDCPFSVAEASCPTEPICYVGDAENPQPADCSGRHDWQVFAFAELPGTVTRLDEVTPDNRFVAALCGQRGLETALGQEAAEFKTALLLPAADDFAQGERTFYCLAGQRDGTLTEPLFVRE